MGERERMEKEIAKQMGYDDVDDALENGDWSKVDPDLVKKYDEYTKTHIDEVQYGYKP
ncbi:hypothetical protein IKP13_04220 [bacterium]|nr:hypothetical protein [bacterium]